MSREDLLARVTGVLATVGAHRYVPFEVTRVEREGRELRIALILHYRRATPVCCGQRGCYVPFLGLKRHELPGALARGLGLPEDPVVSMSVRLEHEAGYAYLNPLPATAVDSTIEYDRTHFAGD